ncbi:MAG: cyclic nucleotide-binding domain-containing protein, partial [Longimicrobiales bacterium]
LLDDADAHVASTALRSFGRTATVAVYPRLIEALGSAATREAARDALAEQGAHAIPALVAALLDPVASRAVRWSVPAVLARIPTVESIAALLQGALAAETDQLLDARAVRALSRLRAHHPLLAFDRSLVRSLINREVAFTCVLHEAESALARSSLRDATSELLRRALWEAGEDRRENVFRCLGLLYEPGAMQHCWYAVARGDARARANAIEWLEHTLDRVLFIRIAPVLGNASRTTRRRDPLRILGALAAGEDAWLACCSRRVAAALCGADAASGMRGAVQRATTGRSPAMDLVDKVFLLQQVDLLRAAQSAHLALLAAIADEIDVEPGAVLARAGEPVAALFVVVSGAVLVTGAAGTLTLCPGAAFGTSAVIDDAGGIGDAVTIGRTRLLRIARDDFRDLLSDHPELAISLLEGLGRRVRNLAAPVASTPLPRVDDTQTGGDDDPELRRRLLQTLL